MNIKRILIIGGIITFIGIIIAVIVVASSKKAIIPPPPTEQDLCKKTCKNGDCNTFGICVCKPGYQGGNCDTLSPKDLCANVNCGPHGNCTDGLCVCIDGYTGTNCSNAPDACIGVDCGTHGSCANGQCVCTKGWSGNKCQTQVQEEVFIILPKNSAGYPLDTDVIEAALASLDKTNNTRLATVSDIETYAGVLGVFPAANTALNEKYSGSIRGPVWVDDGGSLAPAYLVVYPDKNGIEVRQVLIDKYQSIDPAPLGGIAVVGLKPAKNSDIANNKFIILPHTSTKWSWFNDPYLTQPDLDQIKSNCLDAADQWSSKDTTSFGLMSNTSIMPDDLKNQLATCPKSCGKFCQYFPDKAYKYKPYSGWAIASASECSTSDADYYDCNKKTTCLNNCTNKGTCDETTKKCTCDPGYYGDDCSKKYCPNNNTCLNDGTCDTATGFCTCPPSVFGEYCQSKQCPEETCSGQGTATCNLTTGVNSPCVCWNGNYTGNICEYESIKNALIFRYDKDWFFPTWLPPGQSVSTKFEVPPTLVTDLIVFQNQQPAINLQPGKYFGDSNISLDVHNFTVFAAFKGDFSINFVSPSGYGFYINTTGSLLAYIVEGGNPLSVPPQQIFSDKLKEVVITIRRESSLFRVYQNKTIVYELQGLLGSGELIKQGVLRINYFPEGLDYGSTCLLGQFELCGGLADDMVKGNQELLMTKFGITD